VALGLNPALYKTSSVGSSGSVPELLSEKRIETAAAQSGSAEAGADHPRPTGLGLLHYSLQHFPVRRRLRVNIIKAEGGSAQTAVVW